jgi:hypothetical protein
MSELSDRELLESALSEPASADPEAPESEGPESEGPAAVTDADPTRPDPRHALPTMSLEQWLETLRRTDRAFYNIMALEVWSIAKTMDGLFPGFWHRFMHNRQMAMKQFVALKKQNSPPES